MKEGKKKKKEKKIELQLDIAWNTRENAGGVFTILLGWADSKQPPVQAFSSHGASKHEKVLGQ